MRRGQRVLVRAYPNKELERIILDEYETYILVCRLEIYDEVLQSGLLSKPVMGFPKEDIITVFGESNKP